MDNPNISIQTQMTEQEKSRFCLMKLVHWGPLASMSICFSLSLAISSTATSFGWWLIFQATMCLTLYHMWCATLIGPGFKRNPSFTDSGDVTKIRKKDGTRYCRRCHDVVLAKRHHCPWINSCVGRHNEKYFFRFLYCTIMVTIQSFLYLTIDSLQRQRFKTFNLFNLGLSLITLIAVTSLLCVTPQVHTASVPIEAKTGINNLNIWQTVPARNFTERECSICKFSVGLLNFAINSKRGGDQIKHIAAHFCLLAKIESPTVCYNLSNLFESEFIKVLRFGLLTPNQVCGLLSNDTCGSFHSPIGDWGVNLNISSELSMSNSKPKHLNEYDMKPYRVLQISDPHVDINYKEGSPADCKEPICCQAISIPRDNTNSTAGLWGTNRCDIPMRTFENSLKNIRSMMDSNPDIEYIIWTGDLLPHDVWKQSKQAALDTYDSIFNKISEYLPTKMIFPTIGNHEMIPVDSFSPSNLLHIAREDSPKWLYNALDVHWSKWLPNTTKKTIIKDGYYSVKAREGLRIISLNTNFCHNKNFWLYIDSKDPGGQLDWLIHELHMAELANEKVHIIGHIPPGCADCFRIWSRNYNKILRRFSDTITSQFFGHTHKDEFEIFYDMNNENFDDDSASLIQKQWKPISVGFIGPSLTVVSGNNPSFRIYTIDPNRGFQPIDYETYYMNLTEANLQNDLNREPNWISAGNFSHQMDIKDTLPETMHQLVLDLVSELKDMNRTSEHIDNKANQTWLTLGGLVPERSRFLKLYKLFWTFNENYNITSFDAMNYESKRKFLCAYVTGQAHDDEACHKFVRLS